MKRTILSLAILSCIGLAQAEYFIQFPVDVTFVKGDGQPSSPIDPETPIEPEIDCETQAAQYPEECVEDLAAWDKFATDNGLTFDENWNGLVWRSKALTALPTEPYPNSNVFNGIDLYNNKLTNLEGFKSINSVGTNLYVYANQLNDITGLINLQSVGGNIYLHNNQLTNLNGLNSLNYVGGSIRLENNQLNNMSGLSNAEIIKNIYIDKTYAGTKLPSDTRFCLLNAGPKFITGYAKKTQVCEPGSDTWEFFAFDKGYEYGADWNSIAWASKGLTKIPTEAYPNSNPTSSIALSSNKLQNVDGLVGLNSVGANLALQSNGLHNIDGLQDLTNVSGYLYLYNNNLTNIDALTNLTNVGNSLSLHSNQLTNLNGLSNLKYVGNALYLYNNPISDISGLSNIDVKNTIQIDSAYNGSKLSSETPFCKLNSATKFSTGYAQKSQLCEPGSDTWESFAFDKGLIYGTDWNTLDWRSKSISVLPTEPYPNSNPNSNMYFNSNKLENVDGLVSIQTIGGNLYLNTNNLTDINGLKNLTSVDSHLMLYGNQLTNVNGLSKLQTVGSTLQIYNNNITDLSGLSNVNVGSTISIDSTYSGPKLAAGSRFCTLNSASKFGSSYAQKSQICEEGLVTWESFAFDNALSYGANWNTIGWASMGFTEIPSEAYPNANPTGAILLNTNQLKDVEGLSSLNSTGGNLYLYNNKLTTLNGLRNLTSVDGALSFYSNNLTNLEGLNKLTTVNGSFIGYTNTLTNVNALSNLMTVTGAMYLQNNQITDLTGLSNANISGTIRIDSTYNGPKMAAESRFCTLNSATKFASGYAQKSQVCEEGTVTWASFAFDNALAYPTNWSSLNWASKTLTTIPADLYPNANPSSYILLNTNQLQEVDGLLGLNTVKDNLLLYSNQLTNLNGLRNLTSVGGILSFYSNKVANLDGLSSLTNVSGNFLGYSNLLTNVNGLSNLMTVGGYMYLQNNQITDITGLSNAKITGYIRIDATYNGPKMAASSRFCTLNADNRFPAGYATKAQVCEI